MSDQVSPIGIEGGPTQIQIDEWKAKFGDVYLIKFSDQEKYLYRPMRRFEYKQIVAMGQAENKSFAEEKIALMCIIWPTIDPTKISTLKAGTISTIVDLVMSSSNFGVSEEPIKL
jgi:hypothetical protein